MTEVELRLVADNKDAVKGIKEVGIEAQKLSKTEEQYTQKRKGLIEKEIQMQKQLSESRLKAKDIENLKLYNNLLSDSEKRLKDLQTAGLQSEKQTESLTQKLGKFALGFITVNAAIKVFKEVIESTDALGDKFAKTLNGWKEGFASMARAIANNDFNDFFLNVQKAVIEGQRYADTSQKITDKERALGIKLKENETLFKQLRVAQDNMGLSNEKRLEAGLKAEALLKQDSLDRIELDKARLENDLTAAAFVSKQSKGAVEQYIKEDAAFMKLVESGNQYNELIKKRDILLQKMLGVI